MDCQLLFGLASAPAVFRALAEALEWILCSHGVCCFIHYHDVFLLLGAPGSSECLQALRTTVTCARSWGSLLLYKVEGPATRLTFLGLELDAASLSLALPQGKLIKLRQLLAAWVGSR